MKRQLFIVSLLLGFSIFISQSYASVHTVNPSVYVDAFIGEFRFSLFGYTSPKALVTIEGMGIYDQTFADNKGYFEFHNRFSPQSPREACLTSQDQLGRITAPTCIPPFPTKYNTRIGPVLLPPTVSLDKENYWVDDEVKLTGQTIPNSKINLSVFTKDGSRFNVIASGAESDSAKRSNLLSYVGLFRRSLRFLLAMTSRPVEAFSFTPLETTADNKGNFSISLPSSRPEFFRFFAQTSYDNGLSPESVKLNIKILPIWMIIIQLLYLLWSVIKSRLLETIIIGELIAITIFFIRRYLHPHTIASSRSLTLRTGFPLINSGLTQIVFSK